MRDLLTGLLLASCLLPIAAGGMQLSSELMKPDAVHVFADLNGEPVWPAEVKRVDPSQQAYERLPAAVSASPVVAEAKPAAHVTMMLGEPPETADALREQNAQSNARLAELQAAKARDWCSARYRSYNPTDNTYQPYGGGRRRTCAAPVEMPTPSVQQVADVGDASEPDANARWCMERYSSYRIEDNTYQPFTGSRKPCPGPRSQSASNAVRAAGGTVVTQF